MAADKDFWIEERDFYKFAAMIGSNDRDFKNLASKTIF